MNDFSFGVVPVRNREGQREYLLVKHHAGHWAFPKGHAEKGENDLEAARREFEEETGLRDYEILDGVSIFEQYAVPGKKILKTVKYFIGVVRGGSVKVQEKEIADHAWLVYEEAFKRMTFNEGKKLLIEAHAHLNPL